jgi:hypothetical protein
VLVLRQWVLEAAEDNTWLGLRLEGQQPLEEILDLLRTARCDERLLEQLVEVEYMWQVIVGGVVCPDPEFEPVLGWVVSRRQPQHRHTRHGDAGTVF